MYFRLKGVNKINTLHREMCKVFQIRLQILEVFVRSLKMCFYLFLLVLVLVLFLINLRKSLF